MKKILGLAALAFIVTGCQSQQAAAPATQPAQPTVATETFSNVISVQQALASADDTYVTLEGTILNKAGDESYWFSDGTGKIRVEIDDDVWRGQNVSSVGNRVRLSGEIDKDRTKTEVDVKQITVIQR